MRVIIAANSEQQEEILMKRTKSDVDLTFVKSISEVGKENDFDAIFSFPELPLDFGIKKFSGKPVFINSVIETLEQNQFPDNFNRINGWCGFIERPVWEVVSRNKSDAGRIFDALGWDVIYVADNPGLVAPRIISMIINEAFFAIGDEISSSEEIDLAVKLGTNYPYGPFEWVEKIGIKNIYLLLNTLFEKDKRYAPAPLLSKKYFQLFA